MPLGRRAFGSSGRKIHTHTLSLLIIWVSPPPLIPRLPPLVDRSSYQGVRRFLDAGDIENLHHLHHPCRTIQLSYLPSSSILFQITLLMSLSKRCFRVRMSLMLDSVSARLVVGVSVSVSAELWFQFQHRRARAFSRMRQK
jgi:hypothetical protein